MSNKSKTRLHQYTTEQNRTNITLLNERRNMPQLSSELVILTFLYEKNIPLRPKTIYGGLIANQDITFSYRTVQNKISSLVDKGDIKKVKVDEKAGEIVDIPENENYRRAYYKITDQGIERVKDDVME